MGIADRLQEFLANPTEGYRKSLFADTTSYLYSRTGEPWFTWADVPLMKQHPAIQLGLTYCRSPFASVNLPEDKLNVPGNPVAASFIKDCFARFWVRGVPLFIDNYHCWGRGVLGIDYRFDRKRKIVRIKKVRTLEPLDVEPQQFLKGRRTGQFAGIRLRSGDMDRTSDFVQPKHVFYFAGRKQINNFCDIPRIAGAVGPWKEQVMPAGASASCRLFYWTRAVGITEVRYPHGEDLVLADGTRVNAQDVARQLGERLMNGVVAAIPNDKHPTMEGEYKWKVEQRPGQSDTAGVLEYRDKLEGKMWMGMGIPEEVIRKEGGAYSGRSIPMESWYGSCDELARMIWDEFREQHLERLMWQNFGIREFDCPLNSLLEDFRAQGQPKDGEAGGPTAQPPTAPRQGAAGQPYTGPRGGSGVRGDDGRVRYGANLSAVPEVQPAGRDRRERQLHAAVALAMVEAAMRKRMGSDDAGDADEMLRWLPELTDPAEAAQAMGAKFLGWIDYGTSRTGKQRWKDETSGQIRYQKSKPGEHAERRKAAQGDAAKGSEIASKVYLGTHTNEELQQLEHHLDKMTVPQLRSVRARLGAAFDNAKQRSKMVDALTRHVRGRLLEPDETPEAEKPAEPKKLTGAAAKTAKREDGTPAAPKKEDVYTVNPASLKTDPTRFQYKVTGIKEGGVTDELKGTSTYNPELGGVLLVWRDPATSEDFVINGHHRHELASRTGAKGVNVRYIDAKDAVEARARGALANIAEGRGSATDAAKFLRDTGGDVDKLKAAGVSLSGKVAAEAVQLRDLSDKAFQDLTTGKLDEDKAVAVAKHLKDPELQDKLFKLLDKREEDGKDWGRREIETAAKKLARAGKVTTTESTLFGDLESEESTFEEEAELESHIGAALNKTVNDYAAVSNAGRAERVKGAGNVLTVEENQKRRQQAAAHVETFEREAGLKSAVSDAIQSGAAELKLAKSKREKDAVKARTLETVRTLLDPSQAQPRAVGAGDSGDAGTPVAAGVQANRPDGAGAGRTRPEQGLNLDGTPIGSTPSNVVGEERGVKFVPHPVGRDNPDEYQTVMVDPVKLDKVWAADDATGHRITPGGGGGEIAGRRDGVNEFLKTGQPLQASHVAIGPGGRVSFADGRHRFSVLRDKGFTQVPVTVHKDDAAKLAEKVNAVAKTPKDIEAATLARAQADFTPFREKYLKGDPATGKEGSGTYDEAGNLTGVTLNTDEWRDLFPEYTGVNAGDVHEASSHLNKQMYAEALKGMKGKGNNTMVVLAGGGGSGKGTAVGQHFDQNQYPIRLDQVSDNLAKLEQKLDEAKANGYKSEYVFVDRHPADAWQGVVGRAVNMRKKGKQARTVPIEVAVHANLAARKTALELLKKRLDIPASVIDNNHGFGRARLITDRDEAIRHLEAQNHDQEQLLRSLRDETLGLHERGEIPTDIAEGLVGRSAIDDRRAQPRPAEGTRGSEPGQADAGGPGVAGRTGTEGGGGVGGPGVGPGRGVTLPDGHEKAGEMDGGAVVGRSKTGDMTTHFPPGLGAAVLADPQKRKALADAVDNAHLFVESRGGLAPIPIVVNQAKKLGLTHTETLAALDQMHAERKAPVHILNEQRELTRKDRTSKSPPTLDLVNMAQATWWKDGSAYHYLQENNQDRTGTVADDIRNYKPGV